MDQDPSNTGQVTTKLIIEQSAHCDWDWVNTFHGYYSEGYGSYEPVEQTLTTAIQMMLAQPGTYLYSFCELAYLREFVKKNPAQLSNIKTVAESFTLASGGITSAENLLTHGEAFIRNYLIGRQWAINELGITPSLQMWIPDDFGHDAQLPIVLHAMGFTGVGFWRIGGNHPDQSTPPSGTPAYTLTNSVGLDFNWQANDGSQIQVHWLNGSYCQGNQLCSIPGNGNQCSNNAIPWNPYTQKTINGFIAPNAGGFNPTVWPTPYRYIPVDCDFCTPFSNLLDTINSWNQCNQSGQGCQVSPQPSGLKGYVAEIGSFDTFMNLVQEYTAPGNPNGAKLAVLYSTPAEGETLFLPNPYYSGCYGSRPELKILHYKTTRTLLLAESMEVFLEYLAFTNSAKWSAIAATMRERLADAWDKLIPSTHHDYITGTSPDTIYKEPPKNGEQLYDLQHALSKADKVGQDILQELASAASSDQGDTTVLVFNSLGFARSGVVEMDSPGPNIQSAIVDGEYYFPAQYIDNSDKLLFLVKSDVTLSGVPSLGYATVDLTNHAPTFTSPLTLGPDPNEPGAYILANEFISATVTPAGVTELYDIVNDPQKKNNFLGSGGTQIVFYKDGGNIYRFGNELPPDDNFDFYLDTTLNLSPQALTIAEQGKVRCTLTTSGSVSFNNQKYEFKMSYSLVLGEPFVRIKITGTAPGESFEDGTGYSVMAKFSFASKISTLTYGTAYHWDTRALRDYVGWPTPPASNVEQMTFEPTHEFVIPTNAAGTYLAAIYHESTPGWAIDSNGDLLGCILRNTPGSQNAGIFGTDNDPHTARLALRVAGQPNTATQLNSPEAGCGPGGPLGEALQLNNPMVGAVVPQTASGELLSPKSIAATSDPRALITAAKTGTMNASDLILRVYQPLNEPLNQVEVTLDSQLAKMYQGQNLNVAGQTALETAMDDSSLSINASGTSFTFTAPLALTTLGLSRETSG